MNQMGLVTCLQGAYEPDMADVMTTTLEFTVPATGNVLLMAQATALCDGDGTTVGVVFTLYDKDDHDVGTATGFATGLNPGHSTVCMTYVLASHLEADTTAKIVISTPAGSTGQIGEGDYYSVAVVELEQSVELLKREA